METIKIGSRKSLLATWQAKHVASMLEYVGLATELKLIDTKGDKIQDVSIAKIGSKGVFTEELEAMLLSHEIDIAVHSAKDLQSELNPAFEIIAYSKRESSDDVIISESDIDLTDHTLVLGTSSTRRIATFKHFYPHITLVDMRGNLQTRVAKMQSGVCHGLVLASAGVNRMDYSHLIKVRLPFDQFIPPVGQGTLAIECCSALSTQKKIKIKAAVNDLTAEKQLLAERSFLKTMQGGCSIPIFGHARVKGNELTISGGILSLDGQRRILHEATGNDPVAVGKQLAKKVLADGGEALLMEIKKLLL